MCLNLREETSVDSRVVESGQILLASVAIFPDLLKIEPKLSQSLRRKSSAWTLVRCRCTVYAYSCGGSSGRTRQANVGATLVGTHASVAM